jgi:predicted deacetylase
MTNLPKPAQYLLRIDDLCPAVHAQRWKCLRRLVEDFGIRPILAVVPANRDLDLAASPPDRGFWSTLRSMQASGAAIALHGLNHDCSTHGRSLVPLHGTSEFAGLDLDAQRRHIARGIEILRSHYLEPKLFVAPRHGFDRDTLRALQEHGIAFVSDGFARLPFLRFGVTWIPMQLWSPAPRDAGLWTICIHPNTAEDALFEKLRHFLISHASQFTSFDRVVAEFEPQRLGPFERACELIATARLRLRHARSRRRSRLSPGAASKCPPTAAGSDSPRADRHKAPPSDRARKTS